MKKIYSAFILLCVFTLVGCSDSENNASSDPQFEEAIITYHSFLNNTLDTSNSLLNRFNTLIDNLYVQDVSSEQFSGILKAIIKDSATLVKEADEQKNVHAELKEFHSGYLNFLNQQHQLFLDSIEMANSNRIDKNRLRQNYLKTKSSQEAVINSWSGGSN